MTKREGILVTRRMISEAGMVSIDKVNKDIQRGRLDSGDLLDIVGYVICWRLVAGGVEEVTGLCSGFEMH